MAVEPNRDVQSSRTGSSPGMKALEWLFGIIGGIAVFLGLFILFGDEDASIGLGGDLSWRVGDIDIAWMYGLLIGGGLLLLAALGLVIYGRGRTREMSARDEARWDLIWHAGIFLVVNAFIWAQDIAIGGGLDYAYWVTIPWAVGLLAHVLVFNFNRLRALEHSEMPMREDKEVEHH